MSSEARALMLFPRPEFCMSSAGLPPAHPGPGTNSYALLLAGDGHVDDIRVAANQSEQLLQVDAGHRGREVDAGALHALIDGEAGIHFSSLYPARPKNLLQNSTDASHPNAIQEKESMLIIILPS